MAQPPQCCRPLLKSSGCACGKSEIRRRKPLVTRQDQTSFESSSLANQETVLGDTVCNSSATEHPRSRAIRVLVLAQDLADAAIHRRVAMLCAGGAQVTAAGFRRVPQP